MLDINKDEVTYLRNRLGLTCDEIAYELDCSPALIRTILSGRRNLKKPSGEKRKKDIETILSMRADGCVLREISDQTGWSTSNISRVIKGQIVQKQKRNTEKQEKRTIIDNASKPSKSSNVLDLINGPAREEARELFGLKPSIRCELLENFEELKQRLDRGDVPVKLSDKEKKHQGRIF